LRLKIVLKLGLGTCLDILNVAEYSYFDASVSFKVHPLCMPSFTFFSLLEFRVCLRCEISSLYVPSLLVSSVQANFIER
jgi:hypothetical protein